MDVVSIIKKNKQHWNNIREDWNTSQIYIKNLGVIHWLKYEVELTHRIHIELFEQMFLSDTSTKGYYDMTQDAVPDIYYAQAYSVFCYNVTVWRNTTNRERLFKQQKKILRLIFNMKPRDSY